MVFVQEYTFKNDEHPVTALSAHGNSSKAKNPYRRILQSTRSKLKASIHAKGTPKSLMDQMYISLGDVFQARSVGVLPRGPQDLYNARRQERLSEYTTRNDKNGSVAQLDGLWVLLERAKREESAVGGDFTFIRDCVIHPEFSVVLADDRQFKDLEHFTTNPIEFCPLQADPTFSIFNENLSLTVTTYRNLKLVNKKNRKTTCVHRASVYTSTQKLADVLKVWKLSRNRISFSCSSSCYWYRWRKSDKQWSEETLSFCYPSSLFHSSEEKYRDRIASKGCEGSR